MAKGWGRGPAPGSRRGGPRKEFAGLRLALLAGAFLGLAYAYGCSPPESLSRPSLSTANDGETAAGATIDPASVRIVDGDTFWVGREKIRIADIDTPEVQGQCSHERDLAAKATDRMEALLDKGPFELHPIAGRDEDRYGRKLRIVVRDGRSLGDQLVAEGLARTWSGRREPWC